VRVEEYAIPTGAATLFGIRAGVERVMTRVRGRRKPSTQGRLALPYHLMYKRHEQRLSLSG